MTWVDGGGVGGWLLQQLGRLAVAALVGSVIAAGPCARALVVQWRVRRRRKLPVLVVVRAWCWVWGLVSGWWEPLAPWLARGLESVGWTAVDVYRSLRHPQPRRLYGVWLYVGMYGKGKTVSMTERLVRLRRQYGSRIAIYTNYGFALEDGPIQGWRHMVRARLSDRNTVFAFDEIGNSFSQKDSKEGIPRDLVPLLTQCRKWGPGVQVLATVQRFGMTEITWRNMAQYIIECRSYFGARLVWQRAFEGVENYRDGVDPDPPSPKRVHAWTWWFVATDAIRQSYDTFFVARRLVEKGEAELPGWDELAQKERDDAQAGIALTAGYRRDSQPQLVKVK